MLRFLFYHQTFNIVTFKSFMEKRDIVEIKLIFHILTIILHDRLESLAFLLQFLYHPSESTNYQMVKNIAEKFNPLRRVQQRHRRQTDFRRHKANYGTPENHYHENFVKKAFGILMLIDTMYNNANKSNCRLYNNQSISTALCHNSRRKCCHSVHCRHHKSLATRRCLNLVSSSLLNLYLRRYIRESHLDNR